MSTLLVAAVLLAAAPDAGAPPDVHPPGRDLTVLGKKIWVEDEGTGPVLLLIPGGGGGSHDYFHPWLRPLARGLRLVTYDGFGRGRSEKAARPSQYSFRRDVEEVEALRRALGIERLAVLGHSYGGFVAEAYALAHPDRVTHLILSNAMVRGADWQRANERFNLRLAATFPELWARVEALRRSGVKESDPRLQAAYGESFPQQFSLFYFFDRRKAAQIRFDETTFNMEQYLAICGPDCDFQVGEPMRSLDFRAGLSRWRKPLLAIAARADGIVTPDLVLALRKALPSTTLVTFEESGHLPFVEEPERYVQVLRDFLASGTAR
jgi:proline iminopeptidase